MTQEELQHLLDSLDEGPLGTRKESDWEKSFNQTGKKLDPETVKKMMKAHIGRKQPKSQKEKVRKALKGKPKSEKAIANLKKAFKENKSHAGKGNSRYGSGNKYILVGTDEVYTPYEIKQKWPGFDLFNNLRQGVPARAGKYKGLHFQIYEEK